ncbi:MAG: cyclic nucleotide-binding protein [Betaproteobacteria bacterium]|nr:cyclic nucleotide-binding protein [Betaproteobacteria bacterium]
MLTRIGKYEIKRLLGKGASASVYLATDTFTNLEVALKVIDPEALKDLQQGRILRSQFLNEASLAGKLNHPHIAAILDAVVTEDSGHIAIEYVPGGDLSQRIKANALFSVVDAIQVAFKCCGALDYAFRQGVVHRDIKPANIMIVKDNDVKITDFGAALLRRSDITSLLHVGSPAYMSPEQIAGETLTEQSDMFSLGIVLYEMLTAHRPFAAPTVHAMLERVTSGELPVAPSKLQNGIPQELDAIVLTALARAPSARFGTWADFALEMVKVGRLSVYQQTISDIERFDALRRVAMLNKLDDGQTWELARAGRWTRLPPHSQIIREDEPGTSLFFLAKGQAKASRHGQPLNVIGAGECFGEMSYIRDAQNRQATVESLTEVVIAEFESSQLELTSPGCQLHFTRAIVRTLVERLEMANARLANAAKA